MKMNEYLVFDFYVDVKIVLDKLDHKLIDRIVSIFEIRDYLQSVLTCAIKSNEYNNFIDDDDGPASLYCMVSYDESLEKNEMIISGSYGMNEIDLVVLGSGEDIYLSEENWHLIKNQVSKVIFHEFIHHIQYLSRLGLPQRDPNRKEIKYSLKSKLDLNGFVDDYRIRPDELDAYTYQVAADFCSYSANPFLFLRNLEITKNLYNINNTTDDIYLYKQDLIKDSKLWKKFIKKIYKHIDSIDNFEESIILQNTPKTTKR